VLTPHAASGPEVEIPEMASARLDVVVARISRRGDTTVTIPTPPSAAGHLRTLATPSSLRSAVASLREASVDVIAYASTTSGYAIGHAAEAKLIRRLRHMAGVPVVTSGLAATQALKTFDVHRVALVHPPWFDEDITDLGARYFRDQEIDVVTLTATPLPKHPDRVRPKQVIDYVSDHADASTEAVFIAGNGFRAAHTIEELERRTGQFGVQVDAQHRLVGSYCPFHVLCSQQVPPLDVPALSSNKRHDSAELCECRNFFAGVGEHEETLRPDTDGRRCAPLTGPVVSRSASPKP
jgi:maleate isomerase